MDLKPGYKQSEIGVIPLDWSVTTVGDEFSVQLGKMLDSEKNVGVPKPYLGNRAIQWCRIELADIGVVKMTPSDLQRFRLREGDLLVCEGGEVGRAAIWKQPIQECYYQKALHRLRPTRGYNVALMLNMLQRLAATGVLLNFVTQTSIAHLPKDKFEKVPLPLPPTSAEQAAIADALSDADALIAALEQVITKKRHVKHGAMQELLTGKRRLAGFGNTPVRYKHTEVGMIPEDWSVSKLGRHVTFKTGPFGSSLHKSDYVYDGVPVINPMQLIDGRIQPTPSMAITEHAALDLSEFRLCAGNVVIGRRGEMGRCACVGEREQGWLCGTGSMIIRPSTSIRRALPPAGVIEPDDSRGD